MFSALLSLWRAWSPVNFLNLHKETRNDMLLISIPCRTRKPVASLVKHSSPSEGLLRDGWKKANVWVGSLIIIWLYDDNTWISTLPNYFEWREMYRSVAAFNAEHVRIYFLKWFMGRKSQERFFRCWYNCSDMYANFWFKTFLFIAIPMKF